MIGFGVAVGPTDGNKVGDEADIDGDPGSQVKNDCTLDCRTVVDIVTDSKREASFDLKKDALSEGVSPGATVDNIGFDTTRGLVVKTEVDVVSEEDVSNEPEEDSTFERVDVVVEVCVADVETGFDAGVNLNPNDDATIVVTDPLVNPVLDTIGFSGGLGVWKVTKDAENVDLRDDSDVGLDSKEIVVDDTARLNKVVPKNIDNDEKKEARVASLL